MHKRSKRIPSFRYLWTVLKEYPTFFQALTALQISRYLPATVLKDNVIYLESGVYSLSLDEQWFDPKVLIFLEPLAITPVNPTHPFSTSDCDTVLERRLAVTNPTPKFYNAGGIVTLTNVDHAAANMEEFYSRDPDLFLSQSKPQSI
ncbi:hypothetical protein Tco_0349795 [Tanacetum coccineum]